MTTHTKQASVCGAGPLLVVIPSVSAARTKEGLLLDEKALTGLEVYSRFWAGRVRSIFREGTNDAILFGKKCDPRTLPFEVVIASGAGPIPNALVNGAAVVLGVGDNHLDFPLARQCRMLDIPLVYVIENIPETRRKIIGLSNVSVSKRVRSLVWELKTELVRRHAFALASALQANGTPAGKKYARVNKNILTYFDTRLSESMMASSGDVAEKAARRAGNAPLRLAFSGRLELLKGADHLLPIAESLVARKVDFRFDIFGPGSLSGPIREAACRAGLGDRFSVHDPLDFTKGLVPWMRSQADLFICCHRQSDPSSTYLETLGCGVPIVSYRNEAFEGILSFADVGWLAKEDKPSAVADLVAKLDSSRDEITIRARAALAFARRHSFEATFSNRIRHLRSVAHLANE